MDVVLLFSPINPRNSEDISVFPMRDVAGRREH
jgi:hypothetical protein